MKILILKPSSLGDVIQALPVLRMLKKRFPGGEFFWWLERSLMPLLEGDPDLAEVVPFDRRRWGSPLHWDEVWRTVRAMRAQRFDWVIDLQSLLRSGAFAWIVDGQFTVGLDDAREGARGFYDVIVPRPAWHAHAVDWYLKVLPALGVPLDWNFAWLPERPDVRDSIREQWNPPPVPWIALQPGARWENKRWPVTHFVELVRGLSAVAPEVHFAILGGKADRILGETIAAANPDRCLNLTGRTSLPEMIEWIRLCQLIVTNDTGPMHVAAALDKPVVAMLGPTEPRRTGPYGQVDRVLQLPLPCVPCMRSECHYEKPLECLRAIAPSQVIARVRQVLATPRAG